MERPQNPQVGQKFVGNDGYLYELESFVDGVPAFARINNNEHGRAWWKDWQDLSAPDIDHPYKGMILVDEYGNQREVAGVCGDIVCLYDGAEKVGYTGYSIGGLKACGFTVKGQTDEVLELTMSEIAEKFSIPVEQLRVKKE